MTEPVELPDLEEARTDRFARIIAIAAVLATVAAAAIGYLESRASDAGSRADVDAQRLAVRAFSEIASRREQADIQYDLFVQRQAQLRRASSALEEIRFGTGAGGRDAELELERARQERLAEETAETARVIAEQGGAPVLDPTGPEGPARDRFFPARFYARSAEEGLRLNALRDAANQESTERGGQISSYVVMLAMLAVAVYLFGFSLTPHGRANRRLFATVASGLAAVAVVWGVFVSLFPPERAPDEAAAAYAAGRTAYEVGDYDEAVRRLDRAIELRPTFAQAYALRAEAEFSAGSPQIGGLTSLTAPESLARAVADQRKALDLGSSDVGLLGNLGFNTLLLGLAENEPQRFDEAVELAREAEDAAGGNPVYTFNRAVAHLAAGEEEAARDAYRDAVERVLEVGDPFSRQAYAAGALTDLELTAEALGGEVAEQARRLKELVVGSVASGRLLDGPPAAAVPAGDVEAIMTPATAIASFGDRKLQTGDHDVSLQWYQREGDLGWAALPEVSGPVTKTDWNPQIGGGAFVRRSYLASTVPPTCLVTTDYRVEVYVDGRLAATAESDPADELGELVAAADPDIGYAICHPPGWRPAANPLPGLVNGFTNGATTRGVYVARVGAGGRGGSGSAEERALRKFERVLTLLFAKQAPQRAGRPETGFLGLAGGQLRSYTFNGGGGVIRAGFGFDANGALLAAIVFGQPEYMQTDEPYEVLNSVSER